MADVVMVKWRSWQTFSESRGDDDILSEGDVEKMKDVVIVKWRR